MPVSKAITDIQQIKRKSKNSRFSSIQEIIKVRY